MLSDKVSVIRYASSTSDVVTAASLKDTTQNGNRIQPQKERISVAAQEAVSTQNRLATSEVNASPERIKEATNQIKHYIQLFTSELDFSVDEETERLVVKLLDKSTGEILRQIPPEEILHIAKMLDKLQGLLYDDRA